MEIRHLSELIVEFFEKLSSWEESVVRDSGLTTAQAHAVEILGHSGPVKMKELAQKIGVTTGTLTVAVDRLEKKNLMRRKPHATDRRSILIELTPQGEQVFKEHNNFHLRMTQELVADLSAEDLETFTRILKTMLTKI